eukprot:m.884049 g.884049  ORF g.884049 m.884049 type:complete len:1470 (-) comp59887_c0_seq2:3899-8308(-)
MAGRGSYLCYAPTHPPASQAHPDTSSAHAAFAFAQQHAVRCYSPAHRALHARPQPEPKPDICCYSATHRVRPWESCYASSHRADSKHGTEPLLNKFRRSNTNMNIFESIYYSLHPSVTAVPDRRTTICVPPLSDTVDSTSSPSDIFGASRPKGIAEPSELLSMDSAEQPSSIAIAVTTERSSIPTSPIHTATAPLFLQRSSSAPQVSSRVRKQTPSTLSAHDEREENSLALGAPSLSSPALKKSSTPSVGLSKWKDAQLLARKVSNVSLLMRNRSGPKSLQSFVSLQLLSCLQTFNPDSEHLTGAIFQGAVLFSDASGFTKLTTRLADEPDGAELLCSIMNGFFSKLLDIICSYGGDVVKFAGDALSILWVVSKDASTPSACKTLQEATLRACACSLEIHEKMKDYLAIDGPDPVYLRLHMGLGCGQVTAIHVGGIRDRWEYILSGPPLTQIALCEYLAAPGETVLSPEAWLVTDGAAVGEIVEGAEEEGAAGCVKLKGVRVKVFPIYHPLIVPINDALAALMKRYIPKAIIPKLDNKENLIAELREVSVIFVNVHGVDLVADSAGDFSQAVLVGKLLMREIQRTLYDEEGSLNKIMVDDKGLTALCALGLPPMHHSDDPIRAVAAALAIVENLKLLGHGITASVGVATGRAFCGVVGSELRREYTLMGEVVNLAARLMKQTATGVVVDEATRTACGADEFGFQFLGAKPLKGFANPVNAYSPSLINKQKVKRAKNYVLADPLHGRSLEKEHLERIIDTFNEKSGGVVVLTGGRGSGKTQLVEALIQIGESRKMVVFRVADQEGKADKSDKASFRRSTASDEQAPSRQAGKNQFTPWRTIFSQLFATAAAESRLTIRDWILWALEEFKEEPSLVGSAWLLNIFLEEGSAMFEEHAQPHQAVAAIKQNEERMRAMLRILLRYAENHSVLVVLHLHTGTAATSNIDTDSWDFAQRVSRHCTTPRHAEVASVRHSLVLAVVTRPLMNLKENVHTHALVTAAEANDAFIRLKQLDEERRLKYAASVVSSITNRPISEAAMPPELVQFLSDRAAGNPKHIEEAVASLIDVNARGPNEGAALTVLENGRIAINCPDLNVIPAPRKMASALQLEFDQLSSAHQGVVRVASTFRSFTPAMICEVMNTYVNTKRSPDDAKRSQETFKRVTDTYLQECIDALVAVDVFEPCAPGIPHCVSVFYPTDITTASSYQFVSKLLQEIVIASMPTEYKQLLQAFILGRNKQVLKAVVRIQSLFRGVKSRREVMATIYSRSMSLPANVPSSSIPAFFKRRLSTDELPSPQAKGSGPLRRQLGSPDSNGEPAGVFSPQTSGGLSDVQPLDDAHSSTGEFSATPNRKPRVLPPIPSPGDLEHLRVRSHSATLSVAPQVVPPTEHPQHRHTLAPSPPIRRGVSPRTKTASPPHFDSHAGTRQLPHPSPPNVTATSHADPALTATGNAALGVDSSQNVVLANTSTESHT